MYVIQKLLYAVYKINFIIKFVFKILQNIKATSSERKTDTPNSSSIFQAEANPKTVSSSSNTHGIWP